MTGNQFSFDYECQYFGLESYLRVEVNGVETIRVMVEEGQHTVHVFRWLPGNVVKNIRIYRETQTMTTFIKLLSVTTDGEILPIEDRKLIEFIGDSITAGHGLIGTAAQTEWSPYIYSTRSNYAILTANELNMDWSILAQSGWGVLAGFDNNRDTAMPKIYDKLCAPVCAIPGFSEAGAGDNWNFNDRHPDITVVSLGTNDDVAFTSPAFVAPDGTEYKLHSEADGTYRREDVEAYKAAVYNFCAAIKSYNPDTLLIWCYNPVEIGLNEATREAVEQYSADHADGKNLALKLPAAKPDMFAANAHPNGEAHRRYADTLVKAIRTISEG